LGGGQRSSALETRMRKWTHYRAQVASLTRDRDETDPELVAARRNLKAARLQDRIASDLHSSPELTVEQRAELATSLVGVLDTPDELTCRRILALLGAGRDAVEPERIEAGGPDARAS
jgi:hypothetical protein